MHYDGVSDWGAWLRSTIWHIIKNNWQNNEWIIKLSIFCDLVLTLWSDLDLKKTKTCLVSFNRRPPSFLTSSFIVFEVFIFLNLRPCINIRNKTFFTNPFTSQLLDPSNSVHKRPTTFEPFMQNFFTTRFPHFAWTRFFQFLRNFRIGYRTEIFTPDSISMLSCWNSYRCPSTTRYARTQILMQLAPNRTYLSVYWCVTLWRPKG